MGGFNQKITAILNKFDIMYKFVPSAFNRPIVDSRWTLNLPHIEKSQWKNSNFRLVIHAQDFCNYNSNNLCFELEAIEKTYEQEYHKQIIFLHWDHNLQNTYTGHIQCVEFPSHSWELVEGLKTQYKEWKSVHSNLNRKYNFLCLNGYPRNHRNKIYNILKDYKQGFVTHPVHNDYNLAPYAKYNFDNVANFIKLKSLYKSAYTSIVTESIYSDTPGIITEKTLLAIAAKHPFMCIGHKQIHNELAERGFKNYDEIFDLGYDIMDSNLRLDEAIQSNILMLTDNNFNVKVAIEKTERNFDFLMNDYMQSIEHRAHKQLTKIIFQP